MNKTLLVTTLLVTTMLSACDKLGINNATTPTVACGSEDANKLVISLVRENIEKEAIALFDDDKIKNNPAFANIGINQIRQMVESIQFSLADVRTTEKTETSSKLQCEATLRLEVPQDMLAKAIEANKIVNDSNKNTADFFEREYRQEGAYYTKNISYSVQPTDDKTKVFATLNQPKSVSDGVSALVGMALLKEPLDTAKREAASQEAAQEAEIQALNNEQQQAELKEWEERHKVALKEINGFWNKLPKTIQDKLQATQTAWNTNQQKTCAVQAKTEAGDPVAEQILKLTCATNNIELRLEELKAQQKSMMTEIIAEAEKKQITAKNRLERAAQRLPADIAGQLTSDYEAWAAGLDNRCKQKDDEFGLAKLECLTKEINNKAKELEGYSIQ